MQKDYHQRTLASNPKRSFIVQAPAGSGKTEILTQRYLRLLSQVKNPEQIVALTFTRKAASEMRARILLALQNVAASIEPTSAHQQQTYHFALNALKHSQQENWNILEQPNRLRILTIDSLCQILNQAIPLAEKQIPYAQLTEKPEPHYFSAAKACFEYALEEPLLQEPLKCVLDHLDNRQDKLLQLFCDLLATRDQWLEPLYSAKEQKREHFEAMIASIEQNELVRFRQSLPPLQQNLLCTLARQVAFIENNPQSERYCLTDWAHFEDIERKTAAGLASLLLTKEGKLRKSFDHHVGLKKEACDAKLYKSLKEASKALLQTLELMPDFIDNLKKVMDLPPPYYEDFQWEMLQSLFALLPFLVGHLQLIFSKHNEVDFSAVSQQALAALGTSEEPTDLTLYLDNTIHHLLIDEFQDTSLQQFHLISQLVQGWQPEDGRTLFLVGDPMQSIYRFRQAEVGLFLKAKQEGIGPITLQYLELCCNFRSTDTIVNWVNTHFQYLFPQKEDIATGAISFSPSVAIGNQDSQSVNESEIKAWQYSNRRLEAEAIVKKAVEELANHPEDSIAILVRSRSQLFDILPVLRSQKIPFQGIDIEPLAKLPHLRDLWSLTQALFMPANRLAWLSLLRSPFCGLSLSDLHIIANYAPKKSIYFALIHLDTLSELSEDGRQRAHFLYLVLEQALATRHQQSVVDWLINTLKALHCEAILTAIEQDDLEQFWRLLDRFSKDGQHLDLQGVKEEFESLYSQRQTTSRLQIMTIHKSKGLEFDCVILPGLGKKSANKDTPLLRWLKLPSSQEEELILVSPIKAQHRESCLLYNYLGKIEEEKEHYELQRLLYVAVTRARKRLYLFDCKETQSRGTFRSFLQKQEFLSEEKQQTEENLAKNSPPLVRLRSSFYEEMPKNSLSIGERVSFPKDHLTRQIGIVAHELMQWICDKHPNNVQELPWHLFENRFKSLGFHSWEKEAAIEILQQQMQQLFDHPIAQWFCKKHQDERNEYELLIYDSQMMSTRIIDRTFIDRDKRWVIDFKTGKEEKETVERHRQQVNEYAKMLTHYSSMPIRCGLYYLPTSQWLEWDYEIAEVNYEY